MGYDLPAAIGACVANKRYCRETGEKEQDIICVTGDGSIQMNLQELQTIIHHQYPIKIFLINNADIIPFARHRTTILESRLLV